MATNKVYVSRETKLKFSEAGVSGQTHLFSPRNVATGAGRVSAQADLGTSHALRYRLHVQFKVGSNITPATAGVQLEVWYATAEDVNTDEDSNLGTSDAALSSHNQILNARQAGVVVPTGTAAGVGPFDKSWIIEIPDRYVQIIFWNVTGQSIENSADGVSFAELVPLPDDIQAAA